jgi:RNA polymerase sigma-70 factor (ECF subfamily)
MNEREIIEGCLENNRESQKALYDRFYGKMLGVCLRYSNGSDEAKEMFHEGFFKVFKNLQNFRESNSLEEWVKRMIVNASIEHIRNNKQNRLIVSTVYANKNTVKQAQNMSDDKLVLHINKEEILKAIQQLTPGYRTVFNLFVIEGYPHKEIAEMLDISEDTSKSNLAKAKFALRGNLM